MILLTEFCCVLSTQSKHVNLLLGVAIARPIGLGIGTVPSYGVIAMG